MRRANKVLDQALIDKSGIENIKKMLKEMKIQLNN